MTGRRRRSGRRSFGERNPLWLGVLGTAALAALMVLAFNVTNLPFLNSARSYRASFGEAGGLGSGDDVIVAGVKVGSVSSVRLHGASVLVTFAVSDNNVELGSATTALIATESVLGKKGLQLTTAGTGRLRPGSTIPRSRTTDPYDITEALSGLTGTVQSIDVSSLSRALQTISTTFQNTPTALRGAVSGLSRISTTLSSRDAALSSLLAASKNVTDVLAQRDAQITTLLTDGTSLLQEVNSRREAVIALLRTATEVSQQLTGLVADNVASLGPTLDQFSRVVTILNDNKKNLDEVLDLLGPFAGSLGEAVSSGPFFDAYIANLTEPTSLVPVLSGLRK